MTAFPDERQRFYLEHEKIIDTWAALADGTRNALSKWLVDCRSDVGDLAEELGATATLYERHNWVAHQLARPTWFDDIPEDPPAAVELVWNPMTIKLPSRPPQVVLKIGPSGEVGDRRRKEFHGRFNTTIRTMEDYEHGGTRDYYQAKRNLPPDESAGPWWNHLDEYRTLLRTGMKQAWDDLCPLVDEWSQDRNTLR